MKIFVYAIIEIITLKNIKIKKINIKNHLKYKYKNKIFKSIINSYHQYFLKILLYMG